VGWAQPDNDAARDDDGLTRQHTLAIHRQDSDVRDDQRRIGRTLAREARERTSQNQETCQPSRHQAQLNGGGLISQGV
jgi:hypothetical protein